MKVRREPGDRGRRHIFRGQNGRIVFAEDQRCLDVFHLDIVEVDAADIVAAVAVSLDADAIVGTSEMSVIDGDVLRTTGNLASDRQPMPMLKVDVGDPDVFTWEIAARRLN